MSKFYDWKKDIKEEELNEIVSLINDDGVIIFPTDTVYGIGGNATSQNVISKIYKLKQRPCEKALSILVKNKDEIEKYAYITNEIERKIIDSFLPGPVTIILRKKKNSIFNLLDGSMDTIGIRIPDNKIVKAIVERCNFPIAAPSANISGKPSCIRIEDVVKDFDGKVDAFIDGGECKKNIPSTIIRVDESKINVIREGAVSIEEINKKIYEGVRCQNG